MKKVLFALMVALATTMCFSSCSDDDDDPITVEDIVGKKFSVKSSDLKNRDIKFKSMTVDFYDANGFTISVDGQTYEKGTYIVADNTITLDVTYIMEDANGKTSSPITSFTGNGNNKIVDNLLNYTWKK